MATTIFDLKDLLDTLRQNDNDVFGVEFYSISNPSNRHYVVMRNEQELKGLTDFYKDYDFKFNKLAI